MKNVIVGAEGTNQAERRHDAQEANDDDTKYSLDLLSKPLRWWTLLSNFLSGRIDPK